MQNTLLYTMGKVGSISVGNVLAKHGIRPLHGHWVSNDHPIGEFPTLKPQFGRVIGNSSSLRVITLIREPVARNISAFFQSLVFFKKYCEDYPKTSAEDLQKIFIEHYDIHYPDRWFELEIMKWFDFDPFKTKFRHKKGYQIYKADKQHRILILRLEDANRCVPEAFHKLLGIKNAKMLDMNTFKDKKRGTGERYCKFLSLPFPEEFLDRNYNLKYAKHFYTKDELAKFKQSWL